MSHMSDFFRGLRTSKRKSLGEFGLVGGGGVREWGNSGCRVSWVLGSWVSGLGSFGFRAQGLGDLLGLGFRRSFSFRV